MVGVLGLLQLLAPLTAFFLKTLKELQFDHPFLFTGVAQLACLFPFLAVLTRPEDLSSWPSPWLLFLVFVLTVASLLVVHQFHRRAVPESSRSSTLVALGFLVYVLAASLLSASLTQFTARELLFERVHGRVSDEGGSRLANVTVVCKANDRRVIATTRSNRRGRYEFLLTREKRDRAQTVSAKKDGYRCPGFINLPSALSQQEVPLECRSTEF